jgi:hypothetical protein
MFNASRINCAAICSVICRATTCLGLLPELTHLNLIEAAPEPRGCQREIWYIRTSSAEKRRKIEYETGQTSAARATKLEMTACECLRMQEHGVTVH